MRESIDRLRRSAPGEHLFDSRDEAAPLVLFFRDALSPGRGEAVELRAAPLVGRAPLGLDESAVDHAVERRIEGALVDLKDVARELTNAFGDSPPVERRGEEALEDEKVEGALKEVGAFGHVDTLSFDNMRRVLSKVKVLAMGYRLRAMGD
jgi:hypothetical protein